MEIRKALPSDAHYISLLGKITFADTFRHYFRKPEELKHYLSITFAEEKIAKSIAKENNTYWLAIIDGLAVGYAKLKKDSAFKGLKVKRPAQLQKIYILRNFHGAGVGKALLDAAVKEATASDSDGLWLSVLESNEKAKGFYEKAKFSPAGNHTFSIGSEEFYFSVMHLPLAVKTATPKKRALVLEY